MEVGLDVGNPGEHKGLHWGTDGAGRRRLLASPHSTHPRKMMIKRATASLYLAPIECQDCAKSSTHILSFSPHPNLGGKALTVPLLQTRKARLREDQEHMASK